MTPPLSAQLSNSTRCSGLQMPDTYAVLRYLGTVGTDRTVGNPSCVYSYPEQQPYAATPSAASRIT